MASKKKKNRLRAKRRKPTRHHIVPSSRNGTSDPENIAKIRAEEHKEYHRFFSNKTPSEIMEYLVSNYWDGQWNYVINSYWENEESMDNRKIPNKDQRELWPRMYNAKKRRHHTIPEYKRSSSGIEERARIQSKEREDYGALLISRTPREIIEHLVFNCWNGQWGYVAQAYKENEASIDNRKIPNENQGELWVKGYGSKKNI